MDLSSWSLRHQISSTALAELVKMLSLDPVAVSAGEAGMSEGAAQKKVRLATNSTGGMLLRNNSGALPDRRGIPVRFGLGNDSKNLNKKFKSSDLIGVTPLRIEPHHIGRVWGVFTAMEMKRPGWYFKATEEEAAQLFFINTVRTRGAIGSFATDPADYFNAIAEFVH